MSKAAQQMSGRPSPPRQPFALGPGAFSDKWPGRPTEPLWVGLRRVPAEDRVRCDSEAVKRADALMPEARRTPSDPLWQRIYEVTFIHFLIGYALCDPQDVSRPLWPDIGGDELLVHDPDDRYERCPVASARFSEQGISRIFDEMEILARLDPVTKREASDDELRQVGEALADGSFFARLAQANTPQAHAVGAHLRMLAGAMIDLMERGREAPLPIARGS